MLGALSDIAVVVTHITPSPGSGFDATQPGGSAGAVTLSQFSVHGGAGEGVGLTDGLGLADGDGEGEGEGEGEGVPAGVGVGVGVGGVADGAGTPFPRS